MSLPAYCEAGGAGVSPGGGVGIAPTDPCPAALFAAAALWLAR